MGVGSVISRGPMGLGFGLVFGFGMFATSAFALIEKPAVEIVTEKPVVYCEEFHLSKPLNIYKDPDLFIRNLALIYSDPQLGWEMLMEENPLLTRVQGTVKLMRLADTRYFRNFGAVAKLYEAADPRFRMTEVPTNPDDPSGETTKVGPEIVPIQICGPGEPYSDFLGFVLTADLEAVPEMNGLGGRMRPSTKGNPIPKYDPNAATSLGPNYGVGNSGNR